MLFDLERGIAFLMCDSTGIRKIFYTLVNGNSKWQLSILIIAETYDLFP